MIRRLLVELQVTFKKNKYKNDFNENPTQSEQGSFLMVGNRIKKRIIS